MFDSYKVAVKLTLVNGVSGVLGALTSQFSTFNKHVNGAQNNVSALEKKLQGIKNLGLVGGGMFLAGSAGLSLFKAPIEAAREYESAYSRFKQFNIGGLANQQADSFARASKIFGTSSTDMMNALNMTVGVFGRDEMHMAYKVAPVIAQLNSANAGLFGGKVGGIESGSFKSINRFIDMRGLATNEKSYMHGLDVAQKIVSGSGGTIQFRDLEQFAKRGGTAFKSLSDDGLFNMMLAIQEMGGSTAGTSLMSTYQNLVGGRTTKKAMAAISGLGLATLGSVHHGTVGGKAYDTVQMTDLVGKDMARTDFMGWLRTYVLPKIKDKPQAEQFDIINSMLSNRTASNLGATGVGQVLQVMRDANMGKNAMGLQGTLDNAKNNPENTFIEMHKKWNSLLTELGITILPMAISGITSLTNVIKGAISFTKEFPLLTKGLTVAFAVLSGIVAVGGVVFLATAAFGALGIALGGGAAIAGGGLLAMLAPVTAGVVAFGAAMYSIKWLYDLANSDNKTDFITKGDWYGKKPDNSGLTWTPGGSIDTIKPNNGSKIIQVNSTINVDGRKQAESVTLHQTRDALKPISGLGRLDPSMQMTPPNLNFGH